MKNSCLTLILFCFHLTLFSQKWLWVETAPIFDPYDITSSTDIFFADKNNGWIITNSSVVFNTEDGGFSWKERSRIDTAEINSFATPVWQITFIDSLTGYALKRYTQQLYLTEDGGITWLETVFFSAIHNLPINSIKSYGKKLFVVYANNNFTKGYFVRHTFGTSEFKIDSFSQNIAPTDYFPLSETAGLLFLINSNNSEVFEVKHDSVSRILFQFNGRYLCSGLSLVNDNVFTTLERRLYGQPESAHLLKINLISGNVTLLNDGIFYNSQQVKYFTGIFISEYRGWLSKGLYGIMESTDGGQYFTDIYEGIEIGKFSKDYRGNVWGAGKNVIKLDASNLTEIGKTESDNGFKVVYDNSTNSVAISSQNELNDLKFTILDLTGKCVRMGNFHSVFEGEYKYIDVSDFSRGIYLVRISNHSVNATSKVLISHH
jgi:hypothetical protein